MDALGIFLWLRLVRFGFIVVFFGFSHVCLMLTFCAVVFRTRGMQCNGADDEVAFVYSETTLLFLMDGNYLARCDI